MRKQFRSEDIVRNGKPNPCPECPKYRTCTKLCDEVEHWVSQDHVGRSNHEVYDSISPRDENGVTRSYRPDHNDFIDQMAYKYEIEEPDTNLMQAAWSALERLNVSHRSMEFARLYYLEGKTLAQTAAALKMSAQAADSRHKILKKEIKDRLARLVVWDNIKEHFEPYWLTYDDMIICFYYNQLLSFKEIAEICGVTYATIHHRISNYRMPVSFD